MKVLLPLSVCLLLAACATAPPERLPRTPMPQPGWLGATPAHPCSARIGRCFEASIGGLQLRYVPTAQQRTALLAAARAAHGEVADVLWLLPASVSGEAALQLQVGSNVLGEEALGPPRAEPELLIYPLEGQAVASEPDLALRGDVQVDGRPLATRQERVNQQRLPPGRYVFSIRYEGTRDWDRKWVWVEVR